MNLFKNLTTRILDNKKVEKICMTNTSISYFHDFDLVCCQFHQ